MNQKRLYGDTIEEWIAKGPAELEIDAVGLWQVVAEGREGFELSGPELIDFVRRSLLALFAAGAKPVRGATDKVHFWTRLDGYSDDPEKMADAIIDEWQKSGRDPDVGGVWFATPNLYEARRSE